MLHNFNFLIFSFILISCNAKNNQDLNLIYNNSLIVDGESHFKNIAQLTFSGENAEAYFSPDGKKLIYHIPVSIVKICTCPPIISEVKYDEYVPINPFKE